MAGTDLLPRELRRYSKQIMLPEIGKPGQTMIKEARVLVVGAGGLGCPVLQYLAAAGIGRIGIVEFAMVDESNLQRQVLYGTSDVGKLKAIIAKNKLEELCLNNVIEIKNLRLDERNAQAITEGYDIVVDATDNISARYIINDACVANGIPMVHGAIYKYEAEIAVFNYRGSATYRCWLPEYDHTKVKNPNPSETGLFGVLPGITGTYMATEVLKIITGFGEVLCNKMLVINIKTNSFLTFNIENIPENHNISNLKYIKKT